MKRVILYGFFIFFLLTGSSIAEDSTLDNTAYNGAFSFKYKGDSFIISNLPVFKDLPPAPTLTGPIAKDIDWSSNKDAWSFRTRLRNGLKEGPNFNGHYRLIMHGCGTSCQVYWVVNVVNGKVIGAFSTSQGAHFNMGSSLIIANMPSAESVSNHIEVDSLYVRQFSFLTIQDDQLITIKEVDIYEEIKKQKTSPSSSDN